MIIESEHLIFYFLFTFFVLIIITFTHLRGPSIGDIDCLKYFSSVCVRFLSLILSENVRGYRMECILQFHDQNQWREISTSYTTIVSGWKRLRLRLHRANARIKLLSLCETCMTSVWFIISVPDYNVQLQKWQQKHHQPQGCRYSLILRSANKKHIFLSPKCGNKQVKQNYNRERGAV